MNDDLIKSLWEQSKQRETKMNSEGFEALLIKSVRTGWSRWRLAVWIYTGMLGLVLVFSALNIASNLANPPWLVVHVAVTGVTLGCLTLCSRVLRELKGLDDPNVALMVLLKRQLRFFHTTFEWWLWIGGVMAWMLSFSVTFWMEDQRGHYRINHAVEFAAVSAAMVFGMYALSRVMYRPIVQRTLAALEDLDAQATNQTRRVAAARKYWIIVTVVLVLALTASVAWAILAWLGTAG